MCLAEIINISDSNNGTYKYYVSDYNNCIKGNFSAMDMRNLNIRVTIYDKSGIVTVYTIPYSFSGVIWEVFEIKNGKVVTLQHSYSNLDGKSWWSEDKNIVEYNKEALAEYKDAILQKNSFSISDVNVYEGMVYYLNNVNNNGSNFYYLLRDIDNDKIDELYITDGILPEEQTIYWMLDYVNDMITFPFYGMRDSTLRTYLLDNNTFCSQRHSGLTPYFEECPEAYTFDGYEGTNEGYNIFQLQGDGTKSTIIDFFSQTGVYNLIEEADVPNKYFINYQITSSEQWDKYIQEYVQNNIIPSEEWHRLDIENLN